MSISLGPIGGAESPPEIIALSHTSLFADEAWKRYRHYTKLASLHPGNDPRDMWVAARRGDEFFKFQRLNEEGGRVTVFDLALEPGETRDYFDPTNPAHVEMAALLRR